MATKLHQTVEKLLLLDGHYVTDRGVEKLHTNGRTEIVLSVKGLNTEKIELEPVLTDLNDIESIDTTVTEEPTVDTLKPVLDDVITEEKPTKRKYTKKVKQNAE